MRFHHSTSVPVVLACVVVATAAAGCRTGGTSYQVKWAKRGDAIAKADKKEKDDVPAESVAKAAPAPKPTPIQQTSASPVDSAVDIEIPQDDAKERRSRWGNIFGRGDKQKRLQLPRTDLIEDDEPLPQQPSFGEL